MWIVGAFMTIIVSSYNVE